MKKYIIPQTHLYETLLQGFVASSPINFNGDSGSGSLNDSEAGDYLVNGDNFWNDDTWE